MKSRGKGMGRQGKQGRQIGGAGGGPMPRSHCRPIDARQNLRTTSRRHAACVSPAIDSQILSQASVLRNPAKPENISSYQRIPTTNMALPTPTIDLLLNLIDTRPQAILTSLAQHPQLASARDAHGYSLVHAAASYNQLDVLRDLVHKYSANVNILDEDGETPLFACEKAEVAKCLVEELGADASIRNEEGKTAEEKIAEEEGEVHEVFQYLKSLRTGSAPATAAEVETADVHPPPPLPNGLNVEMGTMSEEAAGDAPDPEIRRRIEELAARPDYESEEVQKQLRELVQDVVSGLGGEEDGRSVRRRVD
jgi:hypothetical protein